MASLRGTQRPLSGDDVPTLEFKGKQHVYAHHLTVPYRPLVPDARKSHGDAADSPDDNLIIHGDNLHALKALLPRYAGRVDCVYIDPPYNTGNENWHYNDNVNSPLMRDWLAQNGPVDGEDLERHDKWLCMMWPRLQLLWELLTDDGAIFVSIDDNEQHHLRALMDEIFGEQNFVTHISWQSRASVQNDTDISVNHEHILVYARMRRTQHRRLKESNADRWWTEPGFVMYPLPLDDERFTNPDDDPRGPWKADPFDAPNVRPNLTYTITNPNTGQSFLPPDGRCWRVTEARFAELLADNRILFGKTGKAKPQLKVFRDETADFGSVETTWFDAEKVGTATEGTQELERIFGERHLFRSPKPSRLIQHLLRLSTKDGDTILDSFAGTGTTAQATLAVNDTDGGNRKFILVECEEYADRLTAERVRRVIDGVPDAKDDSLRKGLGGTFTYCTLGAPIELEAMLKGDALPGYSALAAYVLHTASGISAGAGALEPMSEDGLFYETEKINYYLLYQPKLEWLRSNEGVVNEARANRIEAECKAQRRKAIVFAPARYISQRNLSAKGITFCQLPYELHNGVGRT